MKKLLLLLTLALVTQLTFAQNVPSYVPSYGLVGYWGFDGNANDQSLNGNNGTVNGASLTTDRFGNADKAYSFNGNSNYIQVANNSSLNPSATITVASWVYLNQYVDNQNFVSKTFTDCIPLVSYSLKMGDPGKNTYVQLQLSINGVNQILQSTIEIPLNQWVLLTGTYDGQGMNLYINGVLNNSISVSGNISNYSTNLNFGRWSVGDLCNQPQHLNGELDDVGLWNRALTQEEITSLYNANQCITNITVTDTLIINVGQLSYNNPVTWANNITIAPNPASSQININFNNITDLNGGTLKVINSLGQEVATTPITLSGTNTTIPLTTWGGAGLYFVQILNAQGIVVDVKKIILQ
jgi:hypothetical protein